MKAPEGLQIHTAHCTDVKGPFPQRYITLLATHNAARIFVRGIFRAQHFQQGGEPVSGPWYDSAGDEQN